MAWNYMRVESLSTGAVRVHIGPGGLSREQAHAGVEGLLVHAELPALAAQWRAGSLGGVVRHERLVWCVYQHAAGDEESAALAEAEALVTAG